MDCLTSVALYALGAVVNQVDEGHRSHQQAASNRETTRHARIRDAVGSDCNMRRPDAHGINASDATGCGNEEDSFPPREDTRRTPEGHLDALSSHSTPDRGSLRRVATQPLEVRSFSCTCLTLVRATCGPMTFRTTVD